MFQLHMSSAMSVASKQKTVSAIRTQNVLQIHDAKHEVACFDIAKLLAEHCHMT